MCGDWDMETRLRVEFSNTQYSQGVYIQRDGLSPVDRYSGASNAVASIVKPYQYTNSAAVYLFNTVVSVLSGDTCYFRFRQRGEVLFASFSEDGVTYSAESSGVCSSNNILSLFVWRSSGTNYTPLRGHFDYLRFTPVTQ